jgi:hypothetical protein
MSSYDLPSNSEGTLSAFGDPEAINLGIQPTPAELTDDTDTLTGKSDPRARGRQALSTAKDKAAAAASKTRAAAPQKARQAGQAVRGNPKTTTAAALLIVLAAAAGTVLTTRRRAAKARAARSPWSKLISR